MALSDEFGSNMVMPVAPMSGGYGGGNGFGGFGGDGGWWILLLFILLGGNAWGNGFGGGNATPYMAAAGTDYAIQKGFDQAALTSGITGVQNAVVSGFGDVLTALCNGFAGVANGFAQAEIANNARQIANMQQEFASQTAVTAGLTGLSSQLASCCCENRLATNDLKYTIATENCADRTQAMQNTRDIIDSQTRGTQAIIDKLCQLELDGFKRENDNLRSQLTMATLRESQTAQNAFISQGFANEVDQLYNRLNSCPVPTTPVYGRTPIFTRQNNNGCNCGCGSF
jgi:hypothetical protein